MNNFRAIIDEKTHDCYIDCTMLCHEQVQLSNSPHFRPLTTNRLNDLIRSNKALCLLVVFSFSEVNFQINEINF